MNNYKSIDSEKIANTYARFDTVLTKGSGATIIDDEGKKLIDFTSGIGVNSLGFCDEIWADAISAQAHTLQHISNLYYTLPQIKLAEILTERSGMKKVFFGNSGAEANECAIKVARKYGNDKSDNKKNKIITLVNSFHGRTIATVTATGQDKYHKHFGPFVDGFSYCPAGDAAALEELADENTCAIMIELIQGEGGVVPIEKEFVEKCAEICKEKDILFIIDEVQTGIGRTGSLFCYERFGIKPDIVTFAKGIGGGLPLGGALLGEKVEDVLGFGDHGTTFGGNPICCAAALTVMDRLTPEFLENVKKKGELIRSLLSEIEDVYDISGMGLMIGFKVRDKASSDVVKEGIKNGILMLTAKDKIRLLPPLIISEDEIKEGIEILKTII